jgi:hypothetical protein
MVYAAVNQVELEEWTVFGVNCLLFAAFEHVSFGTQTIHSHLYLERITYFYWVKNTKIDLSMVDRLLYVFSAYTIERAEVGAALEC